MHDPLDPILDQPLIIEPDADASAHPIQLANHDIIFESDTAADLHNLFWPWADETYAKSITIEMSAPREEEFVPMIGRLFPSHHEAIYGTEGVIVTKQIIAPYKSEYDRSVMWLLQCQAEGDRLLRLDVEIDWGEPLEQRMVDGLLVAQRNPGEERGLYAQKNAESTRVFGNPDARPSELDIDDPQRARLVYYVLVNGVIEVPLLLTLSDVGEQMAWTGFLAIRDGQRVFDKSSAARARAAKRGRLWTPDTQLNRQLHEQKLAALADVQQLRSGYAPKSRSVCDVPRLVATLDAVDPLLSHNLLAHLRRLAKNGQGKLPLKMPLRRRQQPADLGAHLPQTAHAYLHALATHLSHFLNEELFTDHYESITLCVEALIRHYGQGEQTEEDLAIIAKSLRLAVDFAEWRDDSANAARWQSELEQMAPRAEAHASPDARSLWCRCGICWQDGNLHVAPDASQRWAWWALLDLPCTEGGDETLTLVWDGTTLHATQPVVSELPVQVHRRIHTMHSDELDFDLTFVFHNDESQHTKFKPIFASSEE